MLMTPSIIAASMFVGTLSMSHAAQAEDLRGIELRRLFEPTPSQLRQEQAGPV